MIFKKLSLFALSLVLSVSLTGCGDDDEEVIVETPKTAVRIAEVALGTFEETVEIVGTIQAREVVAVSPERGGKVTQVFAEEGDNILAGQKLAMLGESGLPSEAQNALRSAETNVNSARTNLKNAQQSTAESVSAAEATAQSVQIALQTAELNLANNQKINADSLITAYESALTATDSVFLMLESSLVTLNDILGLDEGKQSVNDAFEHHLGALDSSSLTTAEYDFRSARETQSRAKQIYERIKLTGSFESVDQLLATARSTLRSTATAAASTDYLLTKTITSASFTSADLAVHISNVNTAESNLNSALSVVESAVQSLRSIRLAEETSKSTYQSAVISAHASLASARQNLAVAQANARQSTDTAQNALSSAEWQLRQARVQYRPLAIISPLAGVVTRRNVEVGEQVVAATSLFEISDISQVRGEVEVTGRVIAQVKKGLTVEITVDAYPDRTFTAVVTNRDYAADPASRTFTVELTVENPESLLLPGMLARAVIAVERQEDVIVVPANAILTDIDTGTSEVFVVETNPFDGEMSIAWKKEVTIGRSNGSEVVIPSGLTLGDQLVVSGADFLDDGDEILIVE